MGRSRQADKQAKEAEDLLRKIEEDSMKKEDDPNENADPAPIIDPNQPAQDPVQEDKPVVSDRERDLLKRAEAAEHKYNVLKGKYDSEVPTLSYKVQVLTNQITQLSDQMERNKVVDTPKKKIEDDPKLQELKKDYPELFEGIETLTEVKLDEVRREIQELRALRQEILETKQSVAKSAEERFVETLNSVPNWRVINNSPAFSEWLEQPEGLSGYSRRSFLDQAVSKLDGPTVVRYLRAFIEDEQSKNAGKKPGNPAPPRGTGSPGAGPGGNPGNNKRKISTAFIDRFYQDLAAGKYRGKEQEAAKLDAEINAALAEGRIDET